MSDHIIPAWKRALLRFLLKVRSWMVISPGLEVELFRTQLQERKASLRASWLKSSGSRSRKVGGVVASSGSIYLVKVTRERNQISTPAGWKAGKCQKRDVRKLLENIVLNSTLLYQAPCKLMVNGSSKSVSLFSKQGLKGVNQDTMLVLEDFASQSGTVFCGVFDGHGPHGHLVARSVRDMLPQKLASCLEDHWPSESEINGQNSNNAFTKAGSNSQLITAWKESFTRAYKLMDKELLVHNEVDCVSSGTTAVTLVKQGNHLFLGNVGDSRAVLGMLADDNSLMALQLTIDLKPNLPKEAARIKRYRGRVFALRSEPSVKRVWLPHVDIPGLAMARSFGDYCLKNFGVISEPVLTYRHLSPNDKFIVLASDGVWDVLSNEQVVEIVASVPTKALAAKAVVEAASSLWRLKYPTSRVDDCTAVCFFLDDLASSSISRNGDQTQSKPASSLVKIHHEVMSVREVVGSKGMELMTVSAMPSNNSKQIYKA